MTLKIISNDPTKTISKYNRMKFIIVFTLKIRPKIKIINSIDGIKYLNFKEFDILFFAKKPLV